MTAAANAADQAANEEQKEVELKAMGENSQMFQDSILQTNARSSKLEGTLQNVGASIINQTATYNSLG